MTRQKILDAIFIVTTISLCTIIQWEWTNVKSFLVGGVLGTWITMKYFTRSMKS